MFNRPLEKPNPELDAINERVAQMEARLVIVEGFKDECDKLHKEIKEHSKRNDDAIQNNTESNILMTKSVNELNVTINQTITDLNNSINKLTTKVDAQETKVNVHEPVVKEIIERDTAIKYNKKLLISAAAIAGSIMTIVGAAAYLISHLTN